MVLFPVNRFFDTVWVKAYFNRAIFSASLFVLVFVFLCFFEYIFCWLLRVWLGIVVQLNAWKDSSTQGSHASGRVLVFQDLESPGKMSLVLERPGN